jgi:hypothetical protein
MRKICAVLILLALAAGSASAEMTDGWWMRHPATVKDGGIMLTFGGSYGFGPGGIVALDYALAKTSFTIGGSLGFNYWGLSSYYGVDQYRVLFPVSARFAWHPDLDVEKLDIYAMVSASLTPALWHHYTAYDYINRKYAEETKFEFWWMGAGGGGVGVRWFFSPTFAFWSEAGYIGTNFITLGVTLAL